VRRSQLGFEWRAFPESLPYTHIIEIMKVIVRHSQHRFFIFLFLWRAFPENLPLLQQLYNIQLIKNILTCV
jgi:hypothetical protein